MTTINSKRILMMSTKNIYAFSNLTKMMKMNVKIFILTNLSTKLLLTMKIMMMDLFVIHLDAFQVRFQQVRFQQGK